MRLLALLFILVQSLLITGELNFVPWAKLIPAKITGNRNMHGNSCWFSERLFNKSAESAWNLFKKAFNKPSLTPVEDKLRFDIFTRNYRMILEHNKRYDLGLTTYKMDINEFTDKTHEELKYLRSLRLPPVGRISRSKFMLDSRVPPESIDWREKGAVTAIKNQGNCGSCWAFSATGAIEGHHFVKHHKLVNLSEQQLVDCSSSFGNNACNGGLMDFAFKYIKKAGGIETEECYPYVSGDTGEENSKCLFNRTCIVAHVKGYVDIPKASESQLKHAVGLEGPVAIAINAGLPSFSFYSSGIYEDSECNGDEMDLDHGVLAVGYGEENGTAYWLVKNSWGPRWGDHGYVKIRRNKRNMCGVATAASYPIVD